jgi:multidrug resistance efflux pump
VRPGDLVKAGQVLAELAEQDLQLEHNRWASELAQHENAYAAAMAAPTAASW